MLINQGSLDSLFTGFNAALKQGLALPSMSTSSLAMEVPSATAIENYPLLVLLSTMKKWIGDRQVQNLEGKLLQVVNDDYEHTIGVNRNSLEDNSYGLYNSLFQQMGVDANNLWPKIAIAALVANAAWLDGSAFFLTTRKFGKNTINNKTTSALSATTYAAARLAMMKYCGFNGDPLGIIPDTLVVGPGLEVTGKKIVGNSVVVESYAGDTDDATILNHVSGPNANHGTAKLEVSPLLVGTYANYWFLAQTKGVVKPVIVQKRKIGALVRWDTVHDECVKKRNENEYGLHYRGAAALTLPPYIYGGLKTA